jgi:hypothetical protein
MSTFNTISYQETVDIINREYLPPLESVPGTMKDSGFVIKQIVPMGTGGQTRHKEPLQTNEYASLTPEGGDISEALIQSGYSKDTFAVQYSKQIVVTRKERVLGKNRRELYDRVTDMAKYYPNREDLNLSMFFSYGTATSYLNQDGITVDISTGDGQPLWSTAHTLTGSTTTYRNRLANNPAVSQVALENMERMGITQTYNNLGETMAWDADILWSTNDPVTVNTIREILQSTAKVSAPNAGVVNVYEGKYEHKILNRVDCNAQGNKDGAKKNYWGLASSKMSSFYHDIYEPYQIQQPATGNNGEDINNLDWHYVTIGMEGSCVVVGRGLLFSSGDGAA